MVCVKNSSEIYYKETEVMELKKVLMIINDKIVENQKSGQVGNLGKSCHP